MPYVKTVWATGSAPKINAENLNKIEDELYYLRNRADDIDSSKIRKKTTATQASAVTTLAAITELTSAVEAGQTYAIDCFVTFQSDAAANGFSIGLLSPTGSLNYVEMVISTDSSNATQNPRLIFPNGTAANNNGSITSAGVAAANTNYTARINGRIVVGETDGDVQILFASENAGNTVTVQAQSILTLTRV